MNGMTKQKWIALGVVLVAVIALVIVLTSGNKTDTTIAPAATDAPTAVPTAEPTTAPTTEPTTVPTAEPTAAPTAKPTTAPTAEPTKAPTAAPTAKPTAEPTKAPTAAPTAKPTAEPTKAPTAAPTVKPTAAPTAVPTAKPTTAPAVASAEKAAQATDDTLIASATATAAPAATDTAIPVTDAPAATDTAVPVTDAPAATDTAVPATDAPAATDTAVPPTDAPVAAGDASKDDIVVGSLYGKDITFKDVRAEFETMLQRTVEMYQMYYGAEVSADDPSIFGMVAESVINERIDREIADVKIKEFGLAGTPEGQAVIDAKQEEIYQQVLAEYKEYLKVEQPDIQDADIEKTLSELLASEGYSLELMREDIHKDVLQQVLEEHVTKDIQVSEEDARTAYTAQVAEAKERYAASPDSFIEEYINDMHPVYTPEGVRLVQHILLRAEGEETSEALMERAKKVRAEIAEGTKTFDAALAEYNQDPGMQQPNLMNGYPISATANNYMGGFVSTGMALAAIGDISEPVATDAGVHILRYAGDLTAGEVPFESVKEELMVSQLEEKKATAIQKAHEDWRTEAGAKVDIIGILPEATPAPELPVEPATDPAAAVPVPDTFSTMAGVVIAESAALLDLPGGNTLATLDSGVTLNIEGSLTAEGKLWNYVSLPENAGYGFVDASALSTEGAIELAAKPDGVHAQTVDAADKAPVFTIVTHFGGVITGELYPVTAPQSVGNFVSLANGGAYDGLIFHRVIPGFMIQGGDPAGNGTGGPGYSIKGEFSANGVENPVKHLRGTLSMARSSALDSAGSQFFICVADQPNLDGQYATFGNVLYGIEAADIIVASERDASDRPLKDQQIKLVRVETYGAEYPFEKM